MIYAYILLLIPIYWYWWEMQHSKRIYLSIYLIIIILSWIQIWITILHPFPTIFRFWKIGIKSLLNSILNDAQPKLCKSWSRIYIRNIEITWWCSPLLAHMDLLFLFDWHCYSSFSNQMLFLLLTKHGEVHCPGRGPPASQWNQQRNSWTHREQSAIASVIISLPTIFVLW